VHSSGRTRAELGRLDRRRAALEFDLGAPELYLYSLDDPLCDPAKLSELIGSRASRWAGSWLGGCRYHPSTGTAIIHPAVCTLPCRRSGRRVSSKCWEASRHVAHAVVNKDEYWALVDSFMQQGAGGQVAG
jgi:hypothetical protein